MFSKNVHIIECPRDAMQGLKHFIPLEKKVAYLNSLLKAGFHTLDCASFVSPKAIPQMADSKEVLRKLSLDGSKTKLLAIVANKRGADEAVLFDNLTYLGFPFSISPAFQLRNTNSTIGESMNTVEYTQNLCLKKNKQLVVYLSMGFGNPYGDQYDKETLLFWADEMVKRDISIISLADTVGMATPDQINFALCTLMSAYPEIEFGVHLHSGAKDWKEKLEAAVKAGCKRFDGTLKGIGGCPMAANELVGNINTEWMINYFNDRNLQTSIDEKALQESLQFAEEIFA